MQEICPKFDNDYPYHRIPRNTDGFAEDFVHEKSFVSIFRENFKINKIPLLLCMTAEYFCNFCTKNAPFPIGETRNSCTPQPFSENDEVSCSITLLFSLDSKNKLKYPSAFCSSFCFLSYYL